MRVTAQDGKLTELIIEDVPWKSLVGTYRKMAGNNPPDSPQPVKTAAITLCAVCSFLFDNAMDLNRPCRR